MAQIDQEFGFGSELHGKYPELIDNLGDMYSNIARALNRKPDLTFHDVDPAASDFRYVSGTIWINRVSREVFILTDKPTQTTANWELLN